MNSEWKTFT